jgi:hypothetical protein
MDELYEILKKPHKECDGYEVHVRHLFYKRNAASLFAVTGLDLTEMFKTEETIENVQRKGNHD